MVLMFTSYCNTLHNIEVQLLNMFGDADGKNRLTAEIFVSKPYQAPTTHLLSNVCKIFNGLKGRLKKTCLLKGRFFDIQIPLIFLWYHHRN